MEPSYDIAQTKALTRRITNASEEAIYDVLGGPTTAGRALGITAQGASHIAANHPIKDRLTALRVQEATRKEGRVVPAAELMQLVPWLGPDIYGPDPGKRRRAEAERAKCPRPESNWDLGFRRPS